LLLPFDYARWKKGWRWIAASADDPVSI